jgi:glutaredoxin
MSNEHLTVLTSLLRQTAAAHHEAFAASDGEDPDWPIWYATHLRKPLEANLNIELTASQLVYCLMNADFEHQARAPDSDWAEFYASELLEHFAPSDSAAADSLALYHYIGCPFCARVTAVIDRLGLDVESRDVMQDRAHRAALIEARGRATVPVLHITSPDGSERWMPESSDIVHYLEQTYG